MKGLIVGLMIMSAAGVARAGDPVCFRGDAFQELGSSGQAAATSSCTKVVNTAGKSRYTTWSCNQTGSKGVSAWFQLPARFNGAVSLVRVFYRAPRALTGASDPITNPSGICFAVSGTVARAWSTPFGQGVNMDSIRGYTDVPDQNAAGPNGANAEQGTSGTPIAIGQTVMMESGGATPGFLFGDPIALIEPGPCASGLCNEQMALLAVLRSPFCSHNMPAAAELEAVCIYP